MKQNFHLICSGCYNRLSTERSVVYAGGKTTKGRCECCGRTAKLTRYIVELPKQIQEEHSQEIRTVRRPMTPERRQQLEERVRSIRTTQSIAAQGLRVDITLNLDPRSVDTLHHYSDAWGKSVGQVVDDIVRQFRNGIRRKRERRAAEHGMDVDLLP